MVLSTTFVVIALVLGYIVIPTALMLAEKDEKKLKVLTIICLLLFLFVLVVGTISKISFNIDHTQITFDFSAGWFNKLINWNIVSGSYRDILINLTMLFPIGCVVCVFNKKSFTSTLIKCAIIGFVIGLIIECVQFIFPVMRSVQLSDIFFNIISVVLGGLYYSLIKKIRNKILK